MNKRMLDDLNDIPKRRRIVENDEAPLSELFAQVL
jgi:hypothetical protein